MEQIELLPKSLNVEVGRIESGKFFWLGHIIQNVSIRGSNYSSFYLNIGRGSRESRNKSNFGQENRNIYNWVEFHP